MKVQLKSDVQTYGLSQGKTYEVISVSKYIDGNRKIDFTIFADGHGQPRSFESDIFDIVDPIINDGWVIDIYGGGKAFSISHHKLSSDEFWEDLSGDDDKKRLMAEAVLKEVYPYYEPLK